MVVTSGLGIYRAVTPEGLVIISLNSDVWYYFNIYAYIMPSVTPYTNLNAGFRYYLVDPDIFDIIDSITYHANISNTNDWEKTGDVIWEFEYSARDTYDPSHTLLGPGAPLSAAFWHEVTQEIITNETMFETYTDLRSKKFRPYAPVTGLSRNLTLCGLRSMSVPLFERCLRTMKSTSSFL